MVAKRHNHRLSAPAWGVLATVLAVAAIACTKLSVSPCAVADETPPVLEIAKDIVLDPEKTYGRIVVKASGITIDARGAAIVGATEGDPKTYKHVGIFADGVSRVTLKNIKTKGWEIGLKVVNGSEWLVEGCDFSDNFHDPEFGWGEQGNRGGIVFENVSRSTLRKCKANRVWDGVSLSNSNENTIAENDFSHCSNTCLRLWTSGRNKITKNNLSWGVRIKTGEVHARDSACVLVEAGSNDNHFLENDITHGGDGVFVRALNGWVSSGNLFERNDASYAHNNCFEAQSPRNTYRGNKANHGSHGFWLGISDKTVVEDNEACYNGDPAGHHNAPFPFNYVPNNPKSGHAGIIFAGPSSHTIARRNKCIGNNGAGIAMFGDASPQRKFKAFHWVLEENVVRENRWGLYMEFADWIDMAANLCEDNRESNLVTGGIASNLTVHRDDPHITRPPKAVLAGPPFGKVGEEFVLDASASTDPDGNPLSFRWDFGDGTTATEPRVKHTFRETGFYRIGMTVTNGRFSDLAYRDFRAAADVPELGTEGFSADWGWEEVYSREGLHLERGKERAADRVRVIHDAKSKVQIADDGEMYLAGKSSIGVYALPTGNPLQLVYPKTKQAGWSLAGKSHLVLWSKMLTGNIHAWKGFMPTVTLYEAEDKFALIRPYDDPRNYPQNSEDRADWGYKTIPLAGDAQWKVEGALPATVNWMTIEFYPWGGMPVRLWIDGMSFR